MNIWHELIARLPFEWTQFAFMRTALLAILVVSPLFALMGTLVVNNRMAFFSDAIGHASLTGVGLGVLLGLADPFWALLAFGLVLGVSIISLQRFTRSAMDTVISLSMSFSIALGVALLGDAVMGRDGLKAAWPRRDKPLAEKEVRELQRELDRRGYEVGDIDGRIGDRLQAALRAYQEAIGEAPDGYPTLALLRRLRLRG